MVMQLDLESLRDPACTRCRFHLDATQICSMGWPPARRKIMVVSKMPNSHNYQDSLENDLRSVGLEPSRIFWTSALKCQNFDRNASNGDVKTCARTYLDAEIERVKPAHILVLGNEALLAVTGHSGIMKYRGRPIDKHGATIIPTISPSSVLRNPGQRQGYVADLQLFANEVNGVDGTALEPDTKIVDTLEKLKIFEKLLRRTTTLVYDIESVDPGTEFHPDARMVSIAFTFIYTSKGKKKLGTVAIPLYHPESPFLRKWKAVLRFLAPALEGVGVHMGHNCFSGDTPVITRAGLKPIRDLAGTSPEIWTGEKWVAAPVKCYGKDRTISVELVPARYRSNISHTIRATPNHRWLSDDGYVITTEELRVGQYLKASKVDITASHESEAFIHGLIFADGSLSSHQPLHGRWFQHQLRLCGAKAKWVGLFDKVAYYPSRQGDPQVTYRSTTNMKQLPSPDADAQYIADFIEGWQLMDGTDYKAGRDVRNKHEENAQWLIDHAATGGWFASGYSVHSYQGGYQKLKEQPATPTYSVKLSKGVGSKPMTWKVKSLSLDPGKRRVYCASVPDEGQKFTLGPGINVANTKYDARWCRQFGIQMRTDHDSLLMAHALDENRQKGLKPQAQSRLGVPPWGIDTKSLISTPISEVLEYNAKDTFYTYHISRLMLAELRDRPRQLNIYKNLLMPASEEYVAAERLGVWMDRERLATRTKVASDLRDDLESQLMEWVPEPGADGWPVMGKREKLAEINFNASNWARWWLFEFLEMPILARGKEKDDGSPGAPSMAEAVIQNLTEATQHPALLILAERSKWQKYCSSFLGTYEEQLDERDRIHTTYKLHGTVTGRTSSGKIDEEKLTAQRSQRRRGVNLQQVPRDPFIRGIFGAPPRYLFVEADFSQIELRLAAFCAQERNMLHLYSAGVDLHLATAARTTGKPLSQVSKDERKKAKPVNFGFLYGMSWRKFIETAWQNYGIHFNEDEAEATRIAFFQAYPDLLTWHNKQRRLVRQFGRVESPMGRVRHLPDIYSPDRGVQSEAERQAINSPVQAMASDMLLLGMTILGQKFRDLGLDAQVIGTVHDACNLQVSEKHIRRVLPMVKQTFETLPLQEQFGVRLNVPVIADLKVGTWWGNAGELSEADVMEFDSSVLDRLREEGCVRAS